MRRRLLAVPMMLLCLLCACAGKRTESVQAPVDFRAGLLRAGGCSLRLEATADVGDQVCVFVLDCVLGADCSAELTLREPETLEGITARIDGDTGSLRFDDVCVTFGLPADSRLSPMEAPGMLIRAWIEGYIASAGTEGEEGCAVYEVGYGPDACRVETRFDADGIPIRAELSLEGRVICKFEISEYQLLSGGDYETTEEDMG